MKRVCPREDQESPPFCGKCMFSVYSGGRGDWLEPSVLPNLFHIIIHIKKYTYLFSTLGWRDRTIPGVKGLAQGSVPKG